MQNINTVAITGNLTRDPEVKTIGEDNKLANLRVAVNGRTKTAGEWEDKANYFDVTVFGRSASACGEYLKKGSPVAVQGRLDWREWETQDGQKRQAVSIIADNVQFLSTRDGSGGDSGNGVPKSDIPVDESEFQPAATGGGEDDDIPF